LTTYRIRAVLLCHDIRLNTHIQVDVTLDHRPDEAEAQRYLWPEAERVTAKNNCEECPYDLYSIEITALSSDT
jgi:hypothetical protein